MAGPHLFDGLAGLWLLKYPSIFKVSKLSMNQRIGYARVSTDDQNLDLQRDALLKAGCGPIYEEAASGKSTDRPELEQCRKALRAGDTLVVWRLDRLGRSLPDLVQIVAELEQQGVAFESLTEKIETSSAAGKLVFHVFAALAEFERNLIRERTHAGLAAARARGRKGGRKPALTPQQVREIKALLRDPSIPVASIAGRYGVSRATIYKHAGADVPARHQSGPSSGPAKGANRV
jgi:DNA invertase Pin-like site-specific DNA recombinase